MLTMCNSACNWTYHSKRKFIFVYIIIPKRQLTCALKQNNDEHNFSQSPNILLKEKFSEYTRYYIKRTGNVRKQDNLKVSDESRTFGIKVNLEFYAQFSWDPFRKFRRKFVFIPRFLLYYVWENHLWRP